MWALSLLRNDQYLVTGCGDNELRVWKIAIKKDDTATDNTWKVSTFEGTESLLPADDLETDSLVCIFYFYVHFKIQEATTFIL